ncbi:MAG: putative sporulation protein YtxC [Ruminiclostridium sp.]|nr:putative sporulation protein YtxC [Ruminiclostridium sp.]
MQFLCIGVNGSADAVMQHITNELRLLKNKKINYSINEINGEGSTSIICSINDSKFYRERSIESYKVLKTYISAALADYIIRQYEEKLLNRIINSNYCYFNSNEKKEILNKSLTIIKNEDKNFFNNLFQIRRKNVIVRRLMDYFENSNNIILDGFVNFRLKEYMGDLEDVVDKGVDDFLMDREYREFIRLLRYFVDIQEPKLNTVHVIVGFDNKYTLLDETKREITNECIQEYVNEIAEGEINYDDLLVSSLITFAPRRIIIHCTGQFRNKELMETIKNVFLGRVLICQGCEICLVNMVKSENKK